MRLSYYDRILRRREIQNAYVKRRRRKPDGRKALLANQKRWRDKQTARDPNYGLNRSRAYRAQNPGYAALWRAKNRLKRAWGRWLVQLASSRARVNGESCG